MCLHGIFYIKFGGQDQKNENAELGTSEINYVKYDCNPPSSFRNVLWKQSACHDI